MYQSIIFTSKLDENYGFELLFKKYYVIRLNYLYNDYKKSKNATPYDDFLRQKVERLILIISFEKIGIFLNLFFWLEF